MVDWAAIFNESHLLMKTSSSLYNEADTVTIGLNPAVTALVTTYDGGKAVIGYSTYDNMTTFGWVLKLWGEFGTNTACNVGDKPAGYIVMTTKPFNITGSTSTCDTNSQWLYVAPGIASTFGDQTAMSFATVFLAAGEDYTASITAPVLYIGGGISDLASYGLGMYNAYLFGVTTDGVVVAPTGMDLDGYEETTHKISSGTSTKIMGLKYSTHGCTTTVASGFRSATNVYIGGSSASH